MIEIRAWGIGRGEMDKLSRSAQDKAHHIAMRQQALECALKGQDYTLEELLRQHRELLAFTDYEITALRDIVRVPGVNILTLDEIYRELADLGDQGKLNDPQYSKLKTREQELKERRSVVPIVDGQIVWDYPDPEFHRHIADEIAGSSPRSVKDLA